MTPIGRDQAAKIWYRTLTVRSGSSVLQTLSNLNSADGYQYEQVDLSAYAGQTIISSLLGW